MSTWRLAARIAWREVRRRPGRTGLVMLLIALPVMGMTAASMVVRAGNLSAEQRFEQRHGQADLVAWLGGPGDSVAADLDALRSVLPGGSEVVPYFGVDSSIGVLRDGRQIASYVTLTDLPLREPVTTGIIDIERGVAPDRAEEMLISPDLASDWGVDIGDRVDTTRPTASWTVTGIGRQTQYLRQSVVVVGELDPEIVRAGARNDRALVRLRAGPPDPALLDRIARLGLVADHAAGADDDGRSDGDALLWGWVGGAVGLAVIGVVASAAFATSGRRQLVTVGQLSANGAGEHVIRRTFLLQGAWSGLLGAALGIVVGAAITSRWWWLAELGADRRLVADRWAPLDLVVIAATATLAATIAALVPSWSASRLPVLAALAGRRPLGRPARWVAPLGLASTIGGLLVLAAAAVEGEGDRATAL
ncbi:MAG: FtsX-like permease family protein, partial [Actinomycetota bacterium]